MTSSYRPCLDHLAVLHDHDAVAERAHDLEIVGDEEVGQAALVAAACAGGR